VPSAWTSVLVDDGHFELEFHVRHIALPKPGDWRQLCIQSRACTPARWTGSGRCGRPT